MVNECSLWTGAADDSQRIRGQLKRAGVIAFHDSVRGWVGPDREWIVRVVIQLILLTRELINIYGAGESRDGTGVINESYLHSV